MRWNHLELKPSLRSSCSKSLGAERIKQGGTALAAVEETKEQVLLKEPDRAAPFGGAELASRAGIDIARRAAASAGLSPKLGGPVAQSERPARCRTGLVTWSRNR